LANVEKWKPLVTTEGFAAGRQWLVDHPEEIASGYAPSKEVIIVWTVWKSLALATRGIRINCTLPGPTDTPMMPDFEEQMGKEFMDNYPIPLGHRQTPDEQAAPLVFLNSPAASAITGESILTDGGTMAALSVGTLDVSAFGF
jgi:NAD(P)-dependent dehydrogenase (short-subunit alcohol dehydrogenase family)